jgi:hypothetical protein
MLVKKTASYPYIDTDIFNESFLVFRDSKPLVKPEIQQKKVSITSKSPEKKDECLMKKNTSTDNKYDPNYAIPNKKGFKDSSEIYKHPLAQLSDTSDDDIFYDTDDMIKKASLLKKDKLESDSDNDSDEDIKPPQKTPVIAKIDTAPKFSFPYNVLYDYSFGKKSFVKGLSIKTSDLMVLKIAQQRYSNKTAFTVVPDVFMNNSIIGLNNVILHYLTNHNKDANVKITFMEGDNVTLKVDKKTHIYIHPSKKSGKDLVELNGDNKFLIRDILKEFPYINKTKSDSKVFVSGKFILGIMIHKSEFQKPTKKIVLSASLRIKECELKYNSRYIKSILETNSSITNLSSEVDVIKL